MIQIFPIKNLPIFNPNDDFIDVIKASLPLLENDDVLVIAHTVISRMENCEVNLETIKPSKMAEKIGKKADKDPREVEVVLQQSKSIVRMSDTLIISETNHGFICANAGVDKSNARPGYLLTLPLNPNKSAKDIQTKIFEKTGKIVGIIISDTFGRIFRKGTTNIAIGSAGIPAILSYKGDTDLFGYVLKTSEVALVDELAAAAGLVIGQSNEGTPVGIIRGLIEINNKAKISLELDENNVQILPRIRNESLFW